MAAFGVRSERTDENVVALAMVVKRLQEAKNKHYPDNRGRMLIQKDAVVALLDMPQEVLFNPVHAGFLFLFGGLVARLALDWSVWWFWIPGLLFLAGSFLMTSWFHFWMFRRKFQKYGGEGKLEFLKLERAFGVWLRHEHDVE